MGKPDECRWCISRYRQERGLIKSKRKTPQWWWDEATESFLNVMGRQQYFTTDDVWADLARRGVPMPPNHKSMGPKTSELRRKGWFSDVHNPVHTRRPTANGRAIITYKVNRGVPS